MRVTIKNHGHSVYERLLVHARASKLAFNIVLQRYAMERLLHRLGISPYADEFVLKGATLFLVWKGESFRVTKDADFLCRTVFTKAGLEKIFREICAIPGDLHDGMVFYSSSVKAQLIREEQAYGGVRITLDAGLHHARLPLQVDIGFGDAVVPPPEQVAFPVILKNPAPQLRAYTRYSMAAEKCNAMVERGIANSRLKDYYDLWLLSNLFTFDFQTLLTAISATFNRRKTIVPMNTPLGLSEAFAGNPQKLAQWKAFISKSKPEPIEPDLSLVVKRIADFLMPVLNAAQDHRAGNRRWSKTTGWKEKQQRRTP